MTNEEKLLGRGSDPIQQDGEGSSDPIQQDEEEK